MDNKPGIKKLLKFFKWTAIVLFGAPVLLYLVWVAGNLKKEELRPELVALLAQHPPQIGEKDNAYFDMTGIASPASMEPHAWGVSWFTQASANDRAALENRPLTPIKLEGYPSKLSPAKLPCPMKKDSELGCLEEVAQNAATVEKLLESETLLLQRFDALLDKDYQEPYREVNFASEFAPNTAGFRAIKLAQARIALEINQGHDDAALARFARETAFILRQTKSTYSLLDLMICTAALNRYQKLLAEYVGAHPKAARAKAKQLAAALEPFDKAALPLRLAFESEVIRSTRSFLSMRMTSAFDDTSGEKSYSGMAINLLLAPLFDGKATANGGSVLPLEYARLADLDKDKYQAGLARLAVQRNQAQAELSPYHFRNPVGEILLAVGGPADFSSYLYKRDDVIANKKLLAFALDLLARNITNGKQIGEEIKAHQADLKHPYTGELPVWDAEKHSLSYASPKEPKLNYAPLAIRL